MQLFISQDYQRNEDRITILEDRIIHQCSRVLRMKAGQELMLQDHATRYTLRILSFERTSIQTQISNTQKLTPGMTNTTIAISYPNRVDKAELIVQKLSEIGVRSIVFFPSERSQYHTRSEHKKQRILTIALEATEQSYGQQLPTISFLDNRDQNFILRHEERIIFHQDGVPYAQRPNTNASSRIAIIGPEGGFSDEELKRYDQHCTKYHLGDSILRMETAAIIAGRLLNQ